MTRNWDMTILPHNTSQRNVGHFVFLATSWKWPNLKWPGIVLNAWDVMNIWWKFHACIINRSIFSVSPSTRSCKFILVKWAFVHCLKWCFIAISSCDILLTNSLISYCSTRHCKHQLSDVTKIYYTVHRQNKIWEIYSIIVVQCLHEIPTLGSTVKWETWQASFPTGMVGPRVGNNLSPLKTNGGIYLFRPWER